MKGENIMKQFNSEYVSTKELGTLSDGRKVELGHYKDKDSNKEYAEKIYLTGEYTTKNGEKRPFVNATGLTIKDLAEMQKIDLSSFNTKESASEMFD